MKSKDEIFCMEWAKLSTKEYVFDIRFFGYWEKRPWSIEFYDLHKWDGIKIHWNGHDARNGDGTTLEEAWESMTDSILEYEGAKTREEALIKAELEAKRDLPRGWGCKEHKEHIAYYMAHYKH